MLMYVLNIFKYKYMKYILNMKEAIPISTESLILEVSLIIISERHMHTRMENP